MEKLISTILSFPSSEDLSDSEYKGQLKSLFEGLQKTPSQAYFSKGDTDQLDLLDYNKNSLGVLFILYARLGNNRDDMFTLWPRVVEFTKRFDSRQLVIAKDMFKRVMDLFIQFCDTNRKSFLIIRPLRNIILRSRSSQSTSMFSYYHAHFAQRCMEAKCFREALPVLDVDVEEFPSARDRDVGYQDHLFYHLYGAMIYMGLKRWSRAAEFLTFVVTCPGSAVSAIQVDAMKKLILVTLLAEGKSRHYPSTTSAGASRAYKALVRPYDSFAHAFNTGDADALRKETISVMESFRQDGNEGLATQCLESFRSFSIANLTHTYSTLGTEQIGQRDFNVLSTRGGGKLDSAQIERYILGMIDRREIRASLSHTPIQDTENTHCMVEFYDFTPAEMQRLISLQAQISRTDNVTAQAQVLDRKLCTSKEWIMHLNKMSRGGGGGGGGGGVGAASINQMLRDGADETDEALMASYQSQFAAAGMGGSGAYDLEDELMRNDMDDTF